MYSEYITIEKDSTEYHPYIAEGGILGQDIESYSKVEKGTVVKVKVSLGQQPTEPPAQNSNSIHFILNTESNCIHKNSSCSAAQKIAPENYDEIDIASDQLADYSGTYWACGKCSKQYSSILPKF
ncbi:MAG: PASTA domain-containing protein [Ruminococcus flavefaciens]|nr:PASTA domain-containing protein [Ruminococcus flavefaciens]